MVQLPQNKISFPKKKVELYNACQVEEYQFGTEELEEFECPDCNGTGEEQFEFEGNVSYEVCSNCGGSGVFYTRI